MGYVIKKEERVWNNPEYAKLYGSAVAQHASDKRFADTMSTTKGKLQYAAGRAPLSIAQGLGMAGRGAKIAGQALGSGVTRAGISGYEAVGDIGTGLRSQGVGALAAARSGGSMRDRQKAGMDAYYQGLERLKSFDDRKYYNTPFGELGSVQKEAQVRADRIIEGEDKLYTALNPMVDTILDVSDVTMVGALPKMVSKFSKHMATKTAKQASKQLDEGLKVISDGGDVTGFVKNKQARDYIAENKNLGEEELRNILLKDWAVENVETGLRTPMSNNNKTFVAGVMDDSIAKNGFDDTLKHLTEIQEGIVKQLDESTSQTRMNREALSEAIENSDEVLQQKAMASHQIHTEELAKAEKLLDRKSPKKVKRAERKVSALKRDLADIENSAVTRKTNDLIDKKGSLEIKRKSTLADATTKKQKRVANRAVRKIDKEIKQIDKQLKNVKKTVLKELKARPKVKKLVKEIKDSTPKVARGKKQNKKIQKKTQEKKASVTRDAKPQKGIKKTIRKETGQVKKEKKVVTTERKLLVDKFRDEVKNVKAGAKLGADRQRKWVSIIQAYAKKHGVTEQIMRQKQVANIKTETQFENILKGIEKRGEELATKATKQGKMDAFTKEIDSIGKVSKRYIKETGTSDVLSTLESTARKTTDPVLKRQVIDQYKKAAETALKAEKYSKGVYEKLHLIESRVGKPILDGLKRRLGVPARNQMFSASLYGGKNFDKEMNLLEKAAKQFDKGDELIPEKAAWGLEQAGIKGALVLPQRLLKEQEKIETLLGSSWFKTVTESIAPRFASPQRMKSKNDLIRDVITNMQKAEVTSDARVAGFKIFFKDLQKLFKQIPKKDRPTSNAMIQSLTEGAPVSGNGIEEKVAKAFRDLLDKNAKYLESTDGKFVRRDGYFPDNEVYDKSMTAMVKKHGIEDGLTAFFKANEKATANHAMAAIHNGMRSDTANFLKARKGEGGKSTDVFASMMKYQSEFERLRLIREASPHISAMKMLGDAVSEETSWVAQYASMLEKSLTAPSDTRVLDQMSSAMYVAKLGVSPLSAMANLAGGASVDFLANGAMATIRGSKRALQNPAEMHRMLEANGMLGGNFIEHGTESLTAKYLKKGSNVLMINQKIAEHTLRTKQLAGLMTDAEYKAFKSQGKNFKFTPERAVELLDNIERTQGHFTKLHTAPIFKTWYGKLALPFTRWMFNSADIMATATKDIVAFPKHGDVNRLKKGAMTYARAYMLYYGGSKLMDYADDDFADTKYTTKLQRKVGRTMKEASTGALGILPSMVESPVLEDMKMVVNSGQIQLAKQGVIDYPFDYEELKTAGDIYMLGTTTNKFFKRKDETVKEMYGKYSKMNPSERMLYKRDVLAENKAVGRDVSGTFQRYERYSKNNITKKEFDLSFVGDKDEKKKRVTQYIKSLPKNKQAETLNRLLKAKVIKREDIK